MKIIQNLNHQITTKSPLALTIGNFDGLHKGHQAILKKMKEIVVPQNGQTFVISFTNHPLEVLRDHLVIPKLCTLEHKIKLLDEEAIDYLALLPFTKEFSYQSPTTFLTNLKAICSFKFLVLGYDAVLGKDRQGSPEEIVKLTKELDFNVEYLPPQTFLEEPISSSKIRSLILAGNLKLVEKLLGRKYSIYGNITPIGEKRITIMSEGLCLPPIEKHSVKVKFEKFIGKGIAHLFKKQVVIEMNDPISTENLGEVIFE